MNRLEDFFLRARANAPELRELEIVPPEAREALYPHRWFVFWTSVIVACARLSEPPTWIFRPPAPQAFNAGWADYQLGYSLSIIVYVSFLLAGGALGDALGRRRVMLWGVALLFGANLFGFFAPTVEWFAVTRVLAGIGGALAMPFVIVHIIFAFPLTARILALGIYTLITLLTAALAPQLQALLYSVFDWRVVLLLPTVLGLVGLWRVYHLPIESRVQLNRRIDILGNGSFALLALALLFGVTQSQAAGGLRSTILTVSLSLASLGAIGLLIWHLRSSRSPEAPTRIPRYQMTILIIIGALMSFGGAVFSGQPRAFFQLIVGWHPILAVAAYAPFALGMLGTLLFIVRIARRITPRLQMTIGFALMAIASAGAALAILPQLRVAAWFIVFLMMIVFGAGFVLTNSAWIFAFTLTARQGINGVNAATNQATFQIGWVVGTAVASYILVSNGMAEIERILLNRGISEQNAALILKNLDVFVQPGPPYLFDLVHFLGENPLEVYTNAYIVGFSTVMLTVAGLLSLGAVVTFIGLRNAEQQLMQAMQGSITHEEIILNQVEPRKPREVK